MEDGKAMKRNFFRKLVAAIGGLTMAAMLPVSSMASAAADPTLRFAADKSTVRAGDTVILSVMADNLPANGWNLLEFAIGYNENQLEPVMVWDDEIEEEFEWTPGPALNLKTSLTDVNFGVNPILGATISTAGQKRNGEILNIRFKVKDTVKRGNQIVLNTTLKQFAQSIIVDGTSHIVELVQPETSTVNLTVV